MKAFGIFNTVLLIFLCVFGALSYFDVLDKYMDEKTQIIIYILVLIPITVKSCILFTRKKFRCPECGHIFKAKWYEFFFKLLRFSTKRSIGCPKCKTRSFLNSIDFE